MSDAMDVVRDRSRSPNRDNGYPRERRQRDRSPRRDRYSSSYRGPPRYREERGRRDYRDTYAPRHGAGATGDYEAKANRKFENSIFIGNLPYDVQWYQLKDHFAQAGPISRADIVTQHGRSRGMGTVEFSDRDTAERAIKMFDRSEFCGREIFVREDLPPPEKSREPYRERDSYRSSFREGPPRQRERDRYAPPRYENRGARDSYRAAPPAQVDGFEVFVGNLPYSFRWQELKDMFRECGDIERADIREGPGGRSKGFGTVVFRTEEAAEAAIERFNGHSLMGRRMDVRHGKFSKAAWNGNPPVAGDAPAAPAIRTDGLSLNSDLTLGVTGDGPESNRLFVGNLPWETAESDLYELFGSITKVVRAELQYGRGGRPSGNAVVETETEEAAHTIISQLNGYEYGNRNLKISFANPPTEEELAALKTEIENVTADNTVHEEQKEETEQQQPAHEEISIAGSAPAADAPVASAIDTGDMQVAEPTEAVSEPVSEPAPVEDDTDMIEE